MPGALGQLGMQAAEGVLGGALGIINAGWNDKRQIRQQQKLQDMQIGGQKEMTDYNMAKQLEMWKATNYSAQKDEMLKAGLNPALAYGMKGGGGVTTGQASGTVTGGQAPTGGGEIAQMMGMGLQRQATLSQIKLNESQAIKNLADAKATGGIKTQESLQGITESQSRVALLAAQTQNEQAKNALLKLETMLKDMERFEQSATQQQRIYRIGYEADNALEQLKQASLKTTIDQQTQQAIIQDIKARSIGAVLQNELTRQGIERGPIETALKSAELQQIFNSMESTWSEVRIKQEIADALKKTASFNTDPINNMGSDAIRTILDILRLTK